MSLNRIRRRAGHPDHQPECPDPRSNYQRSRSGARLVHPPVAPPCREAFFPRRLSGSGRAVTPLLERFEGGHPQAGESGRNTVQSRDPSRTASRTYQQLEHMRDRQPGSTLPSLSRNAYFKLYIRGSSHGARFGALESNRCTGITLPRRRRTSTRLPSANECSRRMSGESPPPSAPISDIPHIE